MSRSCYLIPVVLASALLLGAVGHAADDTAAIAPPRLERGAAANRRGTVSCRRADVASPTGRGKGFRRTGQRPPRSAVAVGRGLLSVGPVRRRDGRPQTSAMDQLAGFARRHPEYDFTAERLETALWQARIELARGKSGRGTASAGRSFPGEEIRRRS